MKRYIVHKSALDVLHITPLDALRELAKEIIITDQPLKYKHLPLVTLLLTDEQVKLLEQNNIFPTEEQVQKDTALGADYEKVRSYFYKTGKRAFKGTGVKVGCLDSGCNTAFVPCEFTVNFADANPFQDVYGHGTKTTSIIKHPTIGLAPDCIMHGIKVMTDDGSIFEASALAGLDYAIDEDLDVINLSWQFSSVNFIAAIATVVASGTVISASSGNSTFDAFTVTPATLPGVVAVNSITEAGLPFYRNIIPNSSIANSHGITIACSGRECECVNKDGNTTVDWGTSFSSPFFTGLYAIYKEALPGLSRDEVLQYTLSRSLKTIQPNFFGAGTPSF